MSSISSDIMTPKKSISLSQSEKKCFPNQKQMFAQLETKRFPNQKPNVFPIRNQMFSQSETKCFPNQKPNVFPIRNKMFSQSETKFALISAHFYLVQNKLWMYYDFINWANTGTLNKLFKKNNNKLF